MTLDEIEELIIGLLAADAGADPAAFRAELLTRGDEMPIDSLLAAEVLARVEQQCGVDLPATAENAKNLQSVTAFARAILALVQEREKGAAETA